MSELDEDVERYAVLAVELATADDRDVVLQRHELDEEAFQELETTWLARLSEAEDEEGDGVPPLLVRFAEAFANAQRAQSTVAIMPLTRYALITRALSRGREVAQVLDKHGLELGDYLRSHQHWTLQLAKDPLLAARFRKLLSP